MKIKICFDVKLVVFRVESIWLLVVVDDDDYVMFEFKCYILFEGFIFLVFIYDANLPSFICLYFNLIIIFIFFLSLFIYKIGSWKHYRQEGRQH